ncbi:hypothetical protein BOTBODRAFT_36952 [Botryobasidium botryosum FD-172 SS1]|uniref:Uncharacterized protein n=1 Tax=Botryobasidium botryosum (strain FD-172 SS1) TaxID=930990 RepID=A0A067MD77_BOTB1|nr:hypothetical protein BOTBODRAFT_36952 [Botryobasidium botryosum FD-172 SS1]
MANSVAQPRSESFIPEGTYNLGDVIRFGDQIYRSLRDNNTGHDTEDSEWWRKG